VVGQLGERGELRADLDVGEAVDTLAALSDFRFALMLRDSYGWSLDRIESWIADSSRALLLRKRRERRSGR
jgi:hypothetical protein